MMWLMIGLSERVWGSGCEKEEVRRSFQSKQTASFEMCEININTAQRDDQNQHHGIKVCDQCQNDDG